MIIFGLLKAEHAERDGIALDESEIKLFTGLLRRYAHHHIRIAGEAVGTTGLFDKGEGKDGIFMTQQSSEGWMKQFWYIYYLMPEYGTIYKLDKTDEILNVVRGEQMYYLTLEKDDEGKSGRGYGNYYYGKPKTLYWFDAKE